MACRVLVPLWWKILNYRTTRKAPQWGLWIGHTMSSVSQHPNLCICLIELILIYGLPKWR